MSAKEGKYLTISLNDEIYGIPILKVREIIGLMEITHIPQTPDYIKGVINLRGKIIPILDLRLKFGLSKKEYNERTCVIVVEIPKKDEIRLMGIVVDTVCEVINIQSKDIDEPPKYGKEEDNEFLTGLGKLKEKVVMLLDIEQIMDTDELNLINKIKESE